MLVLSRQRDESIVIGNFLVITVVEIRGDKVRLGIQAPDDVSIYRMEVAERIARELLEAAGSTDTEIAAELELLRTGRQMSVELPTRLPEEE
jgi:carbon storage regulator